MKKKYFFLSLFFLFIHLFSSFTQAASVIGSLSSNKKLKVLKNDGSMDQIVVTVPKKMTKYLSSLTKAPYLKFHGDFKTEDHFQAKNIPTIYSGNYAYKGKLTQKGSSLRP